MSTMQYSIYKRQVFDLAKTLIIKMDELSIAINQELTMTGLPLYDVALREQFPGVPIQAFYKYYTNLSGEYHISDIEKLMKTTGTPYMQIKLVANKGTYLVDFNKQLLEKNPSVANEYRYGSYYYNQLVKQYPEFEPLILGILYPVKLEIAVGAKNGEILHCGGWIKDVVNEQGDIGFIQSVNSLANSKVETQEINFISELQKWINKYIFRWTNKDYTLIDDLYAAASIALMYIQIPQVMMNIRLGNALTPYAHSFHIKQYLESKGELGHVVDSLPLKATLWLYRNMRYYECNFGKEFTLRDIVDNVFTVSGIPLAGYVTMHNNGNMPNEILPHAELIRETLNFDSLATSSNQKQVMTMLEDALDKARDNERELEYANERIVQKIEYCGDDTLSTKILESEMLSLPGRYPFTLTSVLLNLWLYLVEENDTVNKGLDGFVYASNPLTGARMAMTMANAYKVVLYCINKAILGTELKNTDGIILKARQVPRALDYVPTPNHHPMPSYSTLWGYTAKTKPANLVDIYTKNKFPRFYTAAETFNAEGTNVFLEMVRQYNVYTQAENYYERAELELCMNRQYWGEIPCKITVPSDYGIWLDEIGVDLNGLNESNLLDLANELIEGCTGLDLSLSKKRADTQKACLDVLNHFTSYTVLVLDKLSFDKGLPSDIKTLRIANAQSYTKKSENGKIGIPLEFEMNAKEKASTVFGEFGNGNGFFSNRKEKLSFKLNVNNLEIKQSNITYRERVDLSSIGVMNARMTVEEFYTDEIPPTPVTLATDLAYYKSDAYPKE